MKHYAAQTERRLYELKRCVITQIQVLHIWAMPIKMQSIFLQVAGVSLDMSLTRYIRDMGSIIVTFRVRALLYRIKVLWNVCHMLVFVYIQERRKVSESAPAKASAGARAYVEFWDHFKKSFGHGRNGT